VGAGIVGASVAYHAARLGADVVLVDRAPPGSGVTGDSFAWIGASGVPPGPVAALRRAATGDYRRLETELPDVRVRWTGSLTWPYDPSAPSDDGRTVVPAAEVARLEPHLREPPDTALHLPGDGAVDPVAVTEALVAGARAHGARVLVGAAVTALRRGADGQCVGVETSGGPVAAPTVVLAAGADVPELCGPTGFAVPVDRSPAVLVRLSAPAGLVRTLLATPELEVRQAADGTLLVALAHEGEATQDELTATGQRARARLVALLDGAAHVRLMSVHVGERPVPVDGEPVVGPVPGAPGVHLAVLHSGVSLAAVVGRLAARELVLGEQVADLQGCRPARFLPGGRSPASGPAATGR
jgi:glycine/D-amino acid oxidase-like deaminating enzyme